MDVKNIENINNKQLMRESTGTLKEKREEKGLLRVPAASDKGAEESRLIQQRHNINHALYYFSMINNAILHGRKNWLNESKAERIAEHLFCSQEFLGDDDAGVKAAVRLLLQNLKRHPDSLKSWAKFVSGHWTAISILAIAFGSKDTSFPDQDLEKISDVARSSQSLKIWWWKIEMKKRRMRIKKILQKVTHG